MFRNILNFIHSRFVALTEYYYVRLVKLFHLHVYSKCAPLIFKITLLGNMLGNMYN